MKTYNVRIRRDTGKDETIQVKALNAGDARWAARKLPNVYEAAVLQRVREKKKK